MKTIDKIDTKILLAIVISVFCVGIGLIAGGAVMVNKRKTDFDKCKATETVKDSCKTNEGLLGGGIVMIIAGCFTVIAIWCILFGLTI